MLLPNFCVLLALSSHLSVFSKLCIMNTPVHFLLLCQSCRSLRNVSFGGHVLGLIKSAYQGWLSITSSGGPLFSFASAPRTLNLPLAVEYVAFFVSVMNCENQDSVQLKLNQFARFKKIMNSEGHRIVCGKLVRSARLYRVCFWPAARERLPTPALDSVFQTRVGGGP